VLSKSPVGWDRNGSISHSEHQMISSVTRNQYCLITVLYRNMTCWCMYHQFRQHVRNVHQLLFCMPGDFCRTTVLLHYLGLVASQPRLLAESSSPPKCCSALVCNIGVSQASKVWNPYVIIIFFPEVSISQICLEGAIKLSFIHIFGIAVAVITSVQL